MLKDTLDQKNLTDIYRAFHSKETRYILLKCALKTFQDHMLDHKTSLNAFQFNSVTQSCLTLCDPLDCSMTSFPVHHQLPELAQVHVHRVSDAIQPSHSPPTFNLSQHQGLFQ